MLEDAKTIMDARTQEWERKKLDLEQRILKWGRVIDPLAVEFAEAAKELDHETETFADRFTSSMDGWKISISPAGLNPDRSGPGGYMYRGAEMIVVGTDGTWAWFRRTTIGFPSEATTERVTGEDALDHDGVLWTDQATDEELTAVLRPIFVERLTMRWYVT